MAPRRSHKKSRAGCLKCKKRRIKCDEVHPNCGNCAKHAIVCDFSERHGLGESSASATPSNGASSSSTQPSPPPPPPPLPPLQASAPGAVLLPVPIAAANTNLPSLGMMVSLPSPSSSYQASPSASQFHPSPAAHSQTISNSPFSSMGHTDPLLLPAPPPSPPLSSASSHLVHLPPFHHSIPPPAPTTSELNLVDLSLMHHWTISTADTISNHSNIQQLWRINIPHLATHHPFLMHGLLAISALHLRSTTEDPVKSAHFLSTAAHHHEHAVRGIAACLSRINQENCDALVVSSCLVVIYSFVSSRVDGAAVRPGLNPNSIAAWVPLIRGVHSILKQSWNWVNNGPLFPLIRQYELSSTDEGLDPETENVLSDLYRLCTDRSLPGSEELSDTAISTAYFSAIAELRKSFATIKEWESVIGSIFVWPITATDKFVELLVERRPRALVIFMHYCALFTLVEEFWWSKGSALFELQRCEMCLGGEWSRWIEWPRMRISEKDVERVVTGRVERVATGRVGTGKSAPGRDGAEESGR